MSTEIGADKLVKIYVKIRDARSALTRKYEAEDGELKEQQDTIKHELLARCKAAGADSLKTEFGTAARTVSTRYNATDWESMHKFIKEHEVFDLLERRLHQTNVKAFLKEHPDLRIPGLNSDSEYTITVYHSKK